MDTFPELNKPPLRGQLKLWTLSELGFRRSPQAEAAGYVCAIPSYRAGTRTFPGYWVAPHDLPKFRALTAGILEARNKELEKARILEAKRVAEYAKSREKAQKLRNDVAAEKVSKLKQAHPSLPPEVEAWVFSEWQHNRFSYKRFYENLRTLLADSKTRWDVAADGQAVLFTTYEERQAAPVARRLFISLERACDLMLRGEERIHQEVLRIGEGARSKLQAMAARFSKECPAWFDESRLLEWVSCRVFDEAHTESHPSLWHFNRLSKERLAALHVERRKKEFRSQVKVELTIGEEVRALKLSLRKFYFSRFMWNAKQAATLEDAAQTALTEAALQEQRSLQSRLDALGYQVHATPKMLAKLSLSAAQWADLAVEVLRRCVHEDDKILVRKLEEARQNRMRELELANCAKALPENLSELYPVARSLRRKLKLVVGPTNSGKTHQALERAMQAPSSLYLGPLRLLALEVRDRLEEHGHPTSLVTGELVELRNNARSISSTIEMLDFDRVVDVAIIDEVQMLGDEQRGSAWVQAILGAPAREVWMLGAPEAEEAVKELAQLLDEPLEIVHTKRLAPLHVDDSAASLGSISSQSAVVAFSRRDVLDIAAELQERHGKKCCVIYGALSPEVRREQAEQFRRGDADIVVATDAIAMGLNLPVHSVYFSTDVKWDGSQEQPIAQDLVQQIAGRAGRFGHHEAGHVGALNKRTLKFIQRAMASRPQAVPNVFRHGPTWPLVGAIANVLKLSNLADILQVFQWELRLSPDPRFQPSLGADQIELARVADKWPQLTLRDRLSLSAAPVPRQRSELAHEFDEFVRHVALAKVYPISRLKDYFPAQVAHSQERAEYAVKMLTLYCWLHYRFSRIFPDLAQAQRNIEKLNVCISEHLRKTKSRGCNECGKRLPLGHRFPKCDACFHAGYGWREDYF